MVNQHKILGAGIILLFGSSLVINIIDLVNPNDKTLVNIFPSLFNLTPEEMIFAMAIDAILMYIGYRYYTGTKIL